MARVKVTLTRGMRALLTDPGVAADLKRRMQPVLAAAQASAPVDSGEYRDSLDLWAEEHPTRSVVHVGSRAKHGLVVEASHGTLARALDSAGG